MCGTCSTSHEQRVRGAEGREGIVSVERLPDELEQVVTEDEQTLRVCFDALLEHPHLAHRVRGRAQRIAALRPEELKLLEVFLGDVGDEGEHDVRQRRAS